MAKKGYWIVLHVSGADGAAMAEYAKLARPVIEAAGGRLIIGGNGVMVKVVTQSWPRYSTTSGLMLD